MDLNRKLADDVSVSPQIAAPDFPAIAAAGFRTVICNRPDGESEDQPEFEQVARAARAAGLEAACLPVASGMVSDAQAIRFAVLVETLPKPVLAYCRSGTRSAILWALSRSGNLPAAEILARARAAGYDLGGMAERLAGDAGARRD